MSGHKIVAIGASAGGLEALEYFFQTVPNVCGVSFFVIQHQSPGHKSITAKLLPARCKLPVFEAEDGQILEPDRVYLSPPGYVPTALGHKVALAVRPAGSSSKQPINAYFESLAKTLGELAVGVVLSGHGTDGVAGAKQIRACGGQVYVQSPREAAFAKMPQSVLAGDALCGVADAKELWPLIAEGLTSGQQAGAQAGAQGPAAELANTTKSDSQTVTISKDLLSAYERLLGRFSIDGFLINREHQILHLFGNAADYCINFKDCVGMNLPAELDDELQRELIALTKGALTGGKRVGTHGVKGKKRAEDCLIDLSVEPVADVQGTVSVLLVEMVASPAAQAEASSHAKTPADAEDRGMADVDTESTGPSDPPEPDLCDRKENLAEQVLLLNQRFKLAVQAAHMSWWDWDLGSGALNVHSAGECLLGDGCLDTARDREGWFSLVHPDDRERVSASLDACLAGESEEWMCEHRFKVASGEWLWVNNRGLVTRRNEAGKALEMMGTTQDIDAYKKALLRSNYQNELLEATGEIIGLGVWEWDPATNQVYYSARTREILGVSPDFNPNAEDSWQFYPQPDHDKLAKSFYALVEDGTPYDIEVRCINAQGKHLLTRAAGRPKYDKDGHLTRVVGLFQDITEVAQLEREMQAYFSLSPDFQATLNFDGRFKTFSSSWSKALGFSKDQLSAMSVQQLVHPDDRDGFMQQLAAVLQGGLVSNYQTRVLDHVSIHSSVSSGDALWMSWSMASDERLQLVFISARCVTEQREAELKLEDALMLAEEANRAKSNFLAVMSHELRTPLNPILGFSELLLEEVEDAEHKEILGTIVESGAHLVELIDEVLDYSSVDAGKLQVYNSEFSLEKLLDKKLSLIRGKLGEKQIEIRGELDKGPFEASGMPLFVGDESILKHILRNLISNAVKFTESGHILLRIRIESAAECQAAVLFEVEDSGVGIELNQQERIFEAFTQGDSSMTRNYGGTGLGLAICKRLAGLMGGSISLQSERGRGACFRVHVPLSYLPDTAAEALVVPSVEAPPLDASQPESMISVIPVAKQKILVVEDNTINRYFLKELLVRQGFDPVTASNGEDALAVFTQEDAEFGAVLLDLHMPGMGGINALEAIREFEKSSDKTSIPVFILTADVLESTRQECLASGATDFIAKPVAVDHLRRILSSL